MTLTLENFSDTEIWAAFDRAADDEGRAESVDIAAELRLADDNATASVGRKFAWYRKYGWFDLEEGRWFYTEWGEILRNPHKLTSAGQRALENLDDSQRVLVMDILTKGLVRSSREAAHAGRRAYAHNFGLQFRDPTISRRRNGGRRKSGSRRSAG